MSQKFIVETSARHVHLTEEHFKILFGAGGSGSLYCHKWPTWTICL